MEEFDLVVRALSFATHMHRHQRRKNAEQTPYIEHPIAVMRALWDGGVREPEVLAAALLHDAIEDTDATEALLGDLFGRDVAETVAECSDDKALPKAERKRRTIAHAGEAWRRARRVELGGRVANFAGRVVNPPADWTPVRVGQYLDWSQQVVDALRGTHPGLESRFDALVQDALLVPWTPEASARDEVDDG